MNLNHLAIFHAVAMEGSISRGARRLMVSQPAVSKQIKLLERSIGLSLLRRHRKGVALMAAGEILAGHLRKMFAIESEAQAAMDELRGLRRGRIVLAASTTAGVYWLPDRLVKFREKFPHIDVHLKLASAADIQHMLLEFTIELGVTEGTIQSPALEFRPFAEEQLVAIAAPAHPLAGKRNATIAQLCRHPFVVRESPMDSQSFVQRALRERGLAPATAMSLASTEAIKHAVAAGIGVAIVPRIAVESDVKAKRLAIVKLRDLSLTRPLRLWTVKERTSSPALAAMLKMLEISKEPGTKPQ